MTRTNNRALANTPHNYVSVLDYGADPTGQVDSSTAIQAAIDASINSQVYNTVYFAPGRYVIKSTINCHSTGLNLQGSDAAGQQGSRRPPTTLRWEGGSAPMFNVSISRYSFKNFGIENGTSATSFIDVSGQVLHNRYQNLSFEVGVSGKPTNTFSEACFRAVGHGAFGYSTWRDCLFGGAAPFFVYIDGTGLGNGTTTMRFYNNVFNAVQDFPTTILGLKNNNVDVLTFADNTFNQLAVNGNNDNSRISAVDASEIDAEGVGKGIYVFNYTGNEFDQRFGAVSDIPFKLVNVDSATIDGNQWLGNGLFSPFVSCQNSTISSFSGNYITKKSSPFFELDDASRVITGHNTFLQKDTAGLVDNANVADNASYVTLLSPTDTYRDVDIAGSVGNIGGVTILSFDMLDTGNVTLKLQGPGNTPGDNGQITFERNGYQTKGQIIGVQVCNKSGGALGKVFTRVAGGWLTAGGEEAFPRPADGFNQTVFYVFNGTHYVELYRSSADTPNSN